MFESSVFYANAPEKLLTAQKLLEAYIKDFAVKSDMEAESLRKYREKRAMCVKTARGASVPATIIVDIAKGESAKEKEEYIKACGAKKTVQYNIEAMKERIYSIRHLCKSIEGQMKTQ